MFDLGVDKGLRMASGILKGSYDVSLTGYNKWVKNIAFLDAPNYSAYPGVHTSYDNEGKEKASGFEFSFRKLQRKPSDWNGYVNYTNQVVRTNSSLYDTAYAPYGAVFLACIRRLQRRPASGPGPPAVLAVLGSAPYRCGRRHQAGC